MIQQLKNLPPAISFGLGSTAAQASAGKPVTVWLGTLYNRDAYAFTLNTEGTVQKISDYEYRVVFDAPGEYHINLTVNSIRKGISLQSNSITLNVI